MRRIWSTKSSHPRRIHLVIKDHVIRYVDSLQPDVQTIQSFGECSLPKGLIVNGKITDPQELLAVLKECLDLWDIKKREVQFLVPDSLVVVRRLEIPHDIEDEEINGYLYLEMGSSIHLPFENPIFNVEMVGLNEDKKEVLLFAAPEDIVLQYADLLEQSGLKPVVADISALSIYRLYYSLTSERRELPVLSVQLDVSSVTISVFHGHKPLLIRQLKLDQLNLSFHDIEYEEETVNYEIHELIDEIERVINYFEYTVNQGEAVFHCFLLTGDHPHLTNVTSKINEAFDTPMITLGEYSFETLNKEPIPARYFLNLGLSIKGAVL